VIEIGLDLVIDAPAELVFDLLADVRTVVPGSASFATSRRRASRSGPRRGR
jgi:hypothetical protein